MLLFVTQIEMSYVKTYRIHIELNLIATLCINVEIKIEYKINISFLSKFSNQFELDYDWLQYLI